MWELDYKETWVLKNWCFWTVVLEKILGSPLDCKEIKSVNLKGNQFWIFTEYSLNIHWSWNSNTLATWCEGLTHWKRPSCWERLKAGGERDNRGQDGWMASLTQWTWIWAGLGRWWCKGWPSVLQCSPWGSRVGHNWATELNITCCYKFNVQVQV